MNTGLYIVSTPIGNSQDITLHAIDILKSAEIILCEDTRKTDFLLRQHNILGKKLFIFNEQSSKAEIIRYLQIAKEYAVALVSDAGTPLVCDPGYLMINEAKNLGIKVFIAPGTCALIASATLCGININNMLFLGFFKKDIKFNTKYTNSLYVAPHDIIALIIYLKKFEDVYIVNISICREATKEFEETLFFNNTKKAIEHFTQKPPRGEFTIFVDFIKNKSGFQNEILSILDDIDGWQMLAKKPLSKFIHKHFFPTIAPKVIYELLVKSHI